MFAPTIAEILTTYKDARAVGIDIPLGIIESYGREADVATRRFIQPHGSAVFPTPPRPVLEAPTYDAARSISDERGWPRPTVRSYGMRRRIVEADRVAQEDERLFEVHPEVSFRHLAGHPLEGKKTLDGQTPTYDCSSIAYFKMVDADGFLCFPDQHQLGLDVLVRVVRNTAGTQ